MGDQLSHPDADRYSQRDLTYAARLDIGAEPQGRECCHGSKEWVGVAEQPPGKGIGDRSAQTDPRDRSERIAHACSTQPNGREPKQAAH